MASWALLLLVAITYPWTGSASEFPLGVGDRKDAETGGHVFINTGIRLDTASTPPQWPSGLAASTAQRKHSTSSRRSVLVHTSHSAQAHAILGSHPDVVRYLPHNTYVLHTTGEALARLLHAHAPAPLRPSPHHTGVSTPSLPTPSIPFIRWYGPWRPEYALSPALLRGLEASTHAQRSLHVPIAGTPTKGSRVNRKSSSKGQAPPHASIALRVSLAPVASCPDLVAALEGVARSQRWLQVRHPTTTTATATYTHSRAAMELKCFDGMANLLRVRLSMLDGAASSHLHSVWPRVVKFVAEHADVLFVSQETEVVSYNQFARGVVIEGRSTAVYDNAFYAQGLNGNRTIVGIIDSGVDVRQCMFRDDNVTVTFDTIMPNHRKIVAYYTSQDSEDFSGHGTHVAGTAVGSLASGPSPEDGIAPGAKLVFEDHGRIGGISSLPLTTTLPRASAAGARVHTNSWGCGANRGLQQTEDQQCNQYTRRDVAADTYTYENNQSLVLFAGGNSGSLSKGGSVHSPCTAKNVLCVGATANTLKSVQAYDPSEAALGLTYWNQDSLAFFSAVGPTFDGRYKPELSAPGYQIKSALNARGCNFTLSTGTSMSAPAAAGAATVLAQYFADGFYPDGVRGSGPPLEPAGSMLRAVLINGGQPLRHRQWDASPRVPLPRPPQSRCSFSCTTNGFVRTAFGHSVSVSLGNGNRVNQYVFHPHTSTRVISMRLVPIASDLEEVWRLSVGTTEAANDWTDVSVRPPYMTAARVELDLVALGLPVPLSVLYVRVDIVGNTNVRNEGATLMPLEFESTTPQTLLVASSCATDFRSLVGFSGLPLDFIEAKPGQGRVRTARYAVRCPSFDEVLNCSTIRVIGTYNYADRSSVCLAAVHAGVLTRDGSNEVRIAYGLAPFGFEYTGSTANGITSTSQTISGNAFVVYSSANATRLLQSLPQGHDPNPTTGFGRVDLLSSVPLRSSPSASVPFLLRVHSSDSARLRTGQNHSYCFSVNMSSAIGAYHTLRTTLVWNDPPAAENAVQPIINDLNLRVTVDGVAVAHGNGRPAGQPDSINTVERVVVNVTQGGIWCMEVFAQSVPMAGSQVYSLVSTAPPHFYQSPYPPEPEEEPEEPPRGLLEQLLDLFGKNPFLILFLVILLFVLLLIFIFLGRRRNKDKSDDGKSEKSGVPQSSSIEFTARA